MAWSNPPRVKLLSAYSLLNSIKLLFVYMCTAEAREYARRISQPVQVSSVETNVFPFWSAGIASSSVVVESDLASKKTSTFLRARQSTQRYSDSNHFWKHVY